MSSESADAKAYTLSRNDPDKAISAILLWLFLATFGADVNQRPASSSSLAPLQ
jgi:hypothetical protein